jgi:ribonuclease T
MFYLSLDVEASGPFPGLFSLVSLAAVPVRQRNPKQRKSKTAEEREWIIDEEHTFYVELKPLGEADEMPAATQVHGLTREYLQEHGLEPLLAMQLWKAYLGKVRPLFGKYMAAAWPASFDIPYVGYYAQRFLGENPLGYNALDIASLAQGLLLAPRVELRARLEKAGLSRPSDPYPHHALKDAIRQGRLLADLFNLLDANRMSQRHAR